MLNKVSNVSMKAATAAPTQVAKNMQKTAKTIKNATKQNQINPVLTNLIRPLDGGISSIGKEADLGKYLHTIA